MAGEIFISIKDMMDYMRSGQPFALTYIKFDKTKGTAGSVKAVEKAVMLTYIKNEDNAAAISNPTSFNHHVKNPNHFNNSTVNIRVTAAGSADIRKVHVMLIRRFNGATVK